MFHERRIELTSPVKKGDNHTLISVSADGTTLAVETKDNTVTILRVADDEIVIRQQEFIDTEHKSDRILAVSPDGQYLAIYSHYWNYREKEELIRIWNTNTGEIIQEFDWSMVFPTSFWNWQIGIVRF